MGSLGKKPKQESSLIQHRGSCDLARQVASKATALPYCPKEG